MRNKYFNNFYKLALSPSIFALLISSTAYAENRVNTIEDYDSTQNSQQQRTAEDQSNSDRAVSNSTRIRTAILDSNKFSLNARNIKIISDAAGNITLRGKVDSQQEKQDLSQLAMQIAGRNTVRNELDVISR